MNEATVYLVPVTFGFGPAALAAAVARQIRARHPETKVTGVADGIALDFLRGSRIFNGALEDSLPGELPDSIGHSDQAVAVFFDDFDRLRQAQTRNLRTVVVDPLYWMWDRDPADPATVDLYLAVAFPGVAERIRERGADAQAIRVVPQIVDQAVPPVRGRSGMVLNLGGAVAPMGINHAYLRALIEVVASVLSAGQSLLVTCSAAAAQAIGRAGPICGATITELPSAQMLATLGRCARLLTLPGQSIMWEALQMQTPTVVLPGANYSQHRQLAAYQRFFSGIPFISWDDLDRYRTLPAGLPEARGVALATELGDRLATDRAARSQLADLIACALAAEPATAPVLRDGHPWADFGGAAEVADLINGLASR